MAKLVRDKIPDLICQIGGSPVVTLDRSIGPLLDKLCEEAAELRAAVGQDAQVEELADLCEVYDAILDRLEIRPGDVGFRRHRKREAKGGFGHGFILHDGPEPKRIAEPENRPIPALERLGRLYRTFCDGDREHLDGITLRTLDNPGWLFQFDLCGTILYELPFEPIKEGSIPEESWIHARKLGPLFQASCGLTRLDDLVTRFLDWAEPAAGGPFAIGNLETPRV